MTKHLKLLIVSGLIFSFIYPHTIYFTEEVDGEIVDKVVKDVLYLGIKDSKVYYYNKYVAVDINCKDVYQIVDNNDEVMEFSCSDSTFNPKLLISEKNKQKNIFLAYGRVIVLFVLVLDLLLVASLVL